MLFFTDPNSSELWQDQALVEILHLCDAHNVPCATNLASAEMMVLGLARGDLDWRENTHRGRF